MKKHHVIFAIAFLLLTLLLNALFGRFISAKISTLPLLQKWNLVSPQAPIVINTREVVREASNQDLQNAISKIKNRISSVLQMTKDGPVITGAALNISEDGVFATTAGAFAQGNAEYRVKLPTGEVLPVLNIIDDPTSNLVLFKAATKNQPVITFAKSIELAVGQSLLSAVSAESPLSVKVQVGTVRSSQKDFEGVYNSDSPSANFNVTGFNNLSAAEPFFNLAGDLVGIWDGSSIYTSDNLKVVIDLFFERQIIIRPVYGFTYKFLPTYKADLLKLPTGYQVVEIKDGPAKTAGLQVGDIVTKAGTTQLSKDTSLEQLITINKPGNPLKLVVSRGGKEIEITITPSSR